LDKLDKSIYRMEDKIEQINKEINKCKESPYYFATKYLTIKTNKGNIVPFTTLMSEQEFNDLFKKYNNGNK